MIFDPKRLGEPFPEGVLIIEPSEFVDPKPKVVHHWLSNAIQEWNSERPAANQQIGFVALEGNFSLAEIEALKEELQKRDFQFLKGAGIDRAPRDLSKLTVIAVSNNEKAISEEQLDKLHLDSQIQFLSLKGIKTYGEVEEWAVKSLQGDRHGKKTYIEPGEMKLFQDLLKTVLHSEKFFGPSGNKELDESQLEEALKTIDVLTNRFIEKIKVRKTRQTMFNVVISDQSFMGELLRELKLTGN